MLLFMDSPVAFLCKVILVLVYGQAFICVGCTLALVQRLITSLGYIDLLSSHTRVRAFRGGPDPLRVREYHQPEEDAKVDAAFLRSENQRRNGYIAAASSSSRLIIISSQTIKNVVPSVQALPFELLK